MLIFLNSASSAAVLVFDLSLCSHTDTKGKPREARLRNIFKNAGSGSEILIFRDKLCRGVRRERTARAQTTTRRTARAQTLTRSNQEARLSTFGWSSSYWLPSSSSMSSFCKSQARYRKIVYQGIWKCNLPHEPSCPSVCRSDGWVIASVCHNLLKVR